MNKVELINVFIDTMEMVNSKTINTNSITSKHVVSEYTINSNNSICNIQTINSDTVSAALEYSKKGKTCILNMASAKRPGGGVVNGAQAQEECLFRCSNLFETISENFYPIKHSEGIYTSDAVFFKDRYYNNINPFTVDVVTIPALNLNPNAKYDDLNIISDYDILMKDKIRLMFHLASKNGCRNIILGAWGCGVFKNNPIDVANLFQEVILEKKSRISPSYSDCFDNIIFAVINDHNSVGNNFDIFFNYFG